MPRPTRPPGVIEGSLRTLEPSLRPWAGSSAVFGRFARARSGEKRPATPKNGQKRLAAFLGARSAHTPPRGHGTARWPFSLPKSSRACPSQGNLLNGQNWLSARGEFRAPRKQRYRPLPGLFEQGTTACATGRPTCQAVSGGVKARATTVGATWRASVVRWPGAEP